MDSEYMQKCIVKKIHLHNLIICCIFANKIKSVDFVFVPDYKEMN